MYFDSFPVIPYDSKGDLHCKDVTNLLRRVSMRAKLKSNTLLYDTYDVKEGETPEMIAHKLYGDPELHWVILLINDITDNIVKQLPTLIEKKIELFSSRKNQKNNGM